MIFSPTLTCAAALIATAALAQAPPAPATPVAPVTVQSGPPAKTVEKQSNSFVQSYATPTAKLDQYARWRDPLCVQVLGLAPEQAAEVTTRVEQVAQGAGAKTLLPGCLANVEVVFVDHPQELIDSVAAKHDWLLGFHYKDQTKALKTVTRPIQAWYATATRGEGVHNTELMFAMVQELEGNSFPGMTRQLETVDNPQNTTPVGCGDSRFSSCLESVFRNVLIVVDRTRVQGQDLGPVEDYLAVLALSQPKTLDGCASMASVIDLYAPAACPGRASAPDGLTPADAAYLTALYATDPVAKKASQQTDVSRRMAKILVTANQGGR
jgi:hypothetical protein